MSIDISRPHFTAVDVGAFCEQSVPSATVQYFKAAKQGMKYWSRQQAIAVLEKRLFWTLYDGGWTLDEVSAKRWKGGWLLSLKVHQTGSPSRRWNAFGVTPNECLAKACHKLGNWGFETKGWQFGD